MKLAALIIFIACFIGLGILLYDQKVDEPHAPIPEAKNEAVIEPKAAGSDMMERVNTESGNSLPSETSQASLDDLWIAAMDVPSDHKLIMAEFRKRGGVVKEEALDKDIDNIVRDHFGNDRSVFAATLKSKGLTLEEFKSQRHDLMAVQAIKGYITRGITDPIQKQKKVDEWLRGLQKSASPGAASNDD